MVVCLQATAKKEIESQRGIILTLRKQLVSRGEQLRSESFYNNGSSVPLSSTRARCNTRSLTAAAAASTTTRSTPHANESHNTTTQSSDQRTADRYAQLFIVK